MKKILMVLLAMAVACAFATETVRGRAPLYCGQLKNSYGYGDTATSARSKANAPWKFKVDTVFVDSDGLGHYKKIGVGAVGAGDTTKAIAMREPGGIMAPMGYMGIAGYRQSANDSGAFTIKPLCWSVLSKAWINSKNLQFDTYNSGSDTLLTTPVDSGGFGIERYLPSYCDSLRFVLTVSGTTGRSSDATKQTSLFRMGVCAY
jgi:hypothetical protein